MVMPRIITQRKTKRIPVPGCPLPDSASLPPYASHPPHHPSALHHHRPGRPLPSTYTPPPRSRYPTTTPTCNTSISLHRLKSRWPRCGLSAWRKEWRRQRRVTSYKHLNAGCNGSSTFYINPSSHDGRRGVFYR